VTSWNPKSPYYDEKSAEDKPRWFCPLVEFREKFKGMITLEQLKKEGQEGTPVSEMQLLRLSRLSVSKVSKKEWDYIMSLVQKL
jgi:predicted RNA-binding protein with PUA-like domain